MSRDITSITRPDPVLLTYYVWFSLSRGPLFFFVFPACYFKYKTLEYEFDEDGISMSWGMLSRTEISVSYSRIQDIHLSRGLIERWMGLATIKIQTASGSSAAELSIVGLTDYEAVRDFLYSRMRGARFGEDVETEKAASEYDDHGDQPEETAGNLLLDIRDELRRLRKTVEGTDGGGQNV